MSAIEAIHLDTATLWKDANILASAAKNVSPAKINAQESQLDNIELKLSPEAEKMLDKLRNTVTDSEQNKKTENDKKESSHDNKKIKDSNEDDKKEQEIHEKEQKEKKEEEQKQQDDKIIQKLAKRDREVKQHEQQHVAAAGSYIKSGPTYSYQVGPDGKRYAVGGQVSIDTSPIPNDSAATIRKAQIVKASALAPANPSAADYSVAVSAAKMEESARIHLREEQQEKANVNHKKEQQTGNKNTKNGDYHKVSMLKAYKKQLNVGQQTRLSNQEQYVHASPLKSDEQTIANNQLLKSDDQTTANNQLLKSDEQTTANNQLLKSDEQKITTT